MKNLKREIVRFITMNIVALSKNEEEEIFNYLEKYEIKRK